MTSLNRMMTFAVLCRARSSSAAARASAFTTRRAYSLPAFHRSEIVGFVAGFGTTFAAIPDLVKMIKRRSSQGINPTMASIMAVFQIAWIYYGLLTVASRDRLERRRRGDQLVDRVGLPELLPQRTESGRRAVAGRAPLQRHALCGNFGDPTRSILQDHSREVANVHGTSTPDRTRSAKDRRLRPCTCRAGDRDGAQTVRRCRRRGRHLPRRDRTPRRAQSSRNALQAKPYGVVVVGGGIRKPDDLVELFEDVIDLIRRHAPQAAIAFNTNPTTSLDAAQRRMP